MWKWDTETTHRKHDPVLEVWKGLVALLTRVLTIMLCHLFVAVRSRTCLQKNHHYISLLVADRPRAAANLVETVVFLAEGDGGLEAEVVRFVPMAKVQLPHLLNGQETCGLTCTQPETFLKLTREPLLIRVITSSSSSLVGYGGHFLVPPDTVKPSSQLVGLSDVRVNVHETAEQCGQRTPAKVGHLAPLEGYHWTGGAIEPLSLCPPQSEVHHFARLIHQLDVPFGNLYGAYEVEEIEIDSETEPVCWWF